MGILEILFGKKEKKKTSAENDTPVPDSEKECEGGIVEIARILSNGDPDVVRDFTLLDEDYRAFAAQYADWCGDMLEGEWERSEALLHVTAYWLTGHDTRYKFGGYIDWKEATEEITAHLEEAIRNLGYPLDVEEIEFTGEEFTNEALQTIDAHFRKKGYTLTTLDIGGDCYHLFIVPLGGFDRLVRLGGDLGLRFFNNYSE